MSERSGANWPSVVAGCAVRMRVCELGLLDATTDVVNNLALGVARGKVLRRHGDDDAVEVANALRRSHERIEVIGRDVDGDADGIGLAGGKFRRESGGRFGLADGIADDDVKPGFAVEEGEHRA